MAEREGFEPPVPCDITSFQDWRLQPLGHLSAFRGGLKRLNIITFFLLFVKCFFFGPGRRAGAGKAFAPVSSGRRCYRPKLAKRLALSCTPTERPASWPSLKRIRQGMLEMP